MSFAEQLDSPELEIPPLPPPAEDFVKDVIARNPRRTFGSVSRKISEELLPKMRRQIKANQREVLQKLEKEKKEKEELVALNQEIAGLTIQLKTLKEEYSEEEQKHKKEVEEVTVKHAAISAELKKATEKDKQLQKVGEKVKQQYNEVKARMEETLKEKQRLDSWLDNHGIRFFLPLSDDGTNTSFSRDVFLEVVDPSGETFNILLDYVDIEKGNFSVASISPSFETAYEVIKEANNSQDFPKFLLTCRNQWKNCTKSPQNCSNQTAGSIFESSPGT